MSRVRGKADDECLTSEEITEALFVSVGPVGRNYY